MRRVICGSGSPLSAQGKGRGQEYSMRKKGIIPGLCLTAACLLLAACGGPDGNAEGAGESGMGAAADSRVMTGLPDIPAGVPEGRQEDLMEPGDWKGQTYWCVGEGPEEDKDSDGEPPEWKAVLGIMQIPQEYLVFADGKLQEVGPMYDQAELTMGYEPLEGCGEQAVIWKISARLYAQTENEKTEDFWYVCFGREDSPQGYIAAMNCRYFSWEDAIAFVKSIQFHDAAWQ